MDAKPNPEPEEYEVIRKLAQLNLDTNQLQESDSEVSVEMVTWNTNGSTGGGAAIRDTLIPIVKVPFKHCITFMQEITICDESVKTRWEFGECEATMLSTAGLREAGVTTPRSGEQLQHQTGEIKDSNESEG